MWLRYVQIPQEIRTIAVPVKWLEYLWDEQRKVLVVKKNKPHSPSISCGARHTLRFILDMLPRGGISLAQAEWRKEKDPGGLNRLVYVRRLKYGEVGFYVLYGNEPEEKVREELFQRKWIYGKGYLVFERVSDLEWKITNAEPEAFVYMMRYGLNSRAACAKYSVISTENVYVCETDNVCCRTYSEAAMLIIADARRPATVEYIFIDAPYRGDPEEIRKRIRILWNDGDVKVEEVENLSEEEVL